MIEQTRAFDLALTAEQTRTIIGSLYDTLVDTRRYLSSYRQDDQPGPLDTCCDAHRARFEERREQAESLRAREAHLLELIALVEKAEAGTGAEPSLGHAGDAVDPERIVLVYRDERGRAHEQPLVDITSAGTLIDPNTGNDLELVSARVGPNVPADLDPHEQLDEAAGFHVVWEIDQDAHSAVEAAVRVWIDVFGRTHADPDDAGIFVVSRGGRRTEVDLSRYNVTTLFDEIDGAIEGPPVVADHLLRD